MYDVDGNVTTNSTASKKHIFHIKLRELINGVSTAQVIISKQTTATITFDYPSTV